MTRSWTVDLADRIRELVGELREAGPATEFTYSWDHGYEQYSHHNEGGGTIQFRGTYHPFGGNCDTGTEDGVGVCQYCGKTWLA